jgi:hypothetical protein
MACIKGEEVKRQHKCFRMSGKMLALGLGLGLA